MPKPAKGPRLGGGAAHERLILANLATQLFAHEAITTTETKAKRLRPYAERLVTFAKRGDLASRRKVLGLLRDKTVVHKLFTELAAQLEEREGGYTRIVKLGYRKGDNAPLARIELVLEPVVKTQRSTKQQGPAAPTADAGEAEPAADEAEVEAAATDAAAEAEAATEEQAEPVNADATDEDTSK